MAASTLHFMYSGAICVLRAVVLTPAMDGLPIMEVLESELHRDIWWLHNYVPYLLSSSSPKNPKDSYKFFHLSW